MSSPRSAAKAADRHERARDILTPNKVTCLLDAAKAGLPGPQLSTLRHFCGFAPADRGHDLRLIQDYLGHRDYRHTVHYTRIVGHKFEGLW